ncbi:Putative membrane protein YdgH [Candidatus Methylomirabilis lanthanidiphila]|uniref:Membrane protein YdgH n=1 Tax=Candidatus Methylomirabilis lanthanidiphila TaxID=2211376 RepID=A0A564ZPE4_9BACT|nr:MMPL family transporter [Candidatus Methylomirabilis lanthanidiphila]VUZ86428.1 Putative membrane protein YdgH [Candidatus Methylomirabilis lanthanidiphila]
MNLRKLLSHTVLAYPRTALVIAGLLSLLSVWVAIARLRFTSTHQALSSLSGRIGQVQERYNEAFGDPDQVVIVVEAADQEQAKRYAAVLAGRLEASADIEEVIYRFDLTSLEDHFLMYLTPQQLGDLRSKIEEHAALLNELSARPSVNRLFQLIHREISSALVGRLFTGFLGEEEEGEVKRPVELQPLIALLTQLEAWASGPRSYTSPWEQFMVEADENGDREGYLWSDNKQLLFVLATVRADTTSLIKFERPIHTIRQEIRSLQTRYPGVKAGVTGGPALEYDEVTAAQRDSGLMTAISLGGVALLVVLVFRSVFRPVMGLIALVMGVCWAFGFAAVTVGHLNMMSMVLAPMLIGIGMDYGIHLAARYEEERGAGHTVHESLEQAFEGAGPGILHAAITTSVGLFALLLTGVSVLQELGLITGCGLLLTLVSTFVVLPPLLLLWDKRPGMDSSAGRAVAAVEGHTIEVKIGEAHFPLPHLPKPPDFMEFWYRRPRTVLLLSAIATLAALYAMNRIEFDGNVLHLQAEGTESVDWELKIIRQSERSTIYGAILAESLEEVRTKTNALEALPSVSKVESIAMLIPEDQERKLMLARELKPFLAGVDLAKLPRPEPVDLDELLNTLQRIKAKMLTAEDAEKWTGKEKPPIEQMARVRRLVDQFERRLQQRGSAEVRRRLTVFQDKLFDDFYDKMSLLDRAVTSGPVQLDDIPNDLKKQFVGRDGSYLIRVYPRGDPWEFASQTTFVRELRTVDPDAVGDPVKGYEVISAMKQGYQQVGIYALIGVAVLFLVNLRDIRYFLLAKVPLLIGAIWIAGLMELFQLKFNLANLIIIPLIVAPGVENGLLIIHRFREEGEAAILPKSIGKGVALSSLTTMIGFGSLLIAHHRGASSIGLLVTLGVGAVLVVSVIVLPALLTVVARRPLKQAVLGSGFRAEHAPGYVEPSAQNMEQETIVNSKEK